MAGGQVSWRRLGIDKVREEGALTLQRAPEYQVKDLEDIQLTMVSH